MSKKFLVPGSLVTSDGSVGEHGLGDFFEAADVGAIHIIDTTGTGGPGLDTASVDVAHDLLEASIHFLPIPADGHGILTLLEAAYGGASGLETFTGAWRTPCSRKYSDASRVVGMLAPSQTATAPLEVKVTASPSSISFCVAQGIAMSHGMDQGRAPAW